MELIVHVVGRLSTAKEQGAIEDKEAEEKTGTKDGTIREDAIPVSMFFGIVTDTGGVLDEESQL